jgi:hypothetical protein
MHLQPAVSVLRRKILRGPLSRLWEFLRVAITTACIGAGIGATTAWFMTVRVAREYQMSMAETGATAGFALGIVLGCIAYYAIFRRQIDFLTLGTIVTLTTILSAAFAFLFHILTDTGGWLALPIGVITFFATCLKLRVPAVSPRANAGG